MAAVRSSLMGTTPPILSAFTPKIRTRISTAVRAQQTANEFNRRSFNATLSVLSIMLPASRALALIPDDDDEELVERARANRKSRLATERVAEKEFTRSEGFVDRAVKRELVPVQRAINSLGLAGKQLAAGEVAAAAGTLDGAWTSEFSAAADSLSVNDSTKAAAAKVVAALSQLQGAARTGSLASAKSEYVALVGSLEGWANKAGIAASLKGL